MKPIDSGLSPVALINRREAIRRVTLMLGGTTLIGGSALLTACADRSDVASADLGDFTADDIVLLDEIAETLLPETSTPGAKAAGVGPFIALMVTDTYRPRQQAIFREGLLQLEAASQEMNGASFLESTPEQRLALLEQLDREQWERSRSRGAPRAPEAAPDTLQAADTTGGADDASGDAFLPDQRQENAPSSGTVSAAPAITADAGPHYFRMIKELALLGYFTSEIGYTQAMRYEETPGRFDPCVPYTEGDRAWAPHA